MKTLRNFKTGQKEVIETMAQRKNKKFDSEPKVQYQCPMKCHGEEVYDEPGLCPDSKMQMIPVGAGHIFY